MAKELGIAVIHGMGSQAPDFGDDMRAEINQWVTDLGKNAGHIAWKSVYWADIIHGRQSRYYEDAKRTADLDYTRLRKFVITALGDATAYQKVSSTANTTYDQIHARVRNSIADLYTSGLDRTDKPLIVLAHSLGAHIMSNYIWDVQHGTDPAAQAGNKFEKLQTLTGLMTFGCNIPLFTFAYKKVVPIAFPPPALPKRLKNKARWLNFYDPDDILAYPLRAINAAYKKVVNEDRAINVGGLFSSWNPLSHNHYWTDNDFTKPVAEFVATLL